MYAANAKNLQKIVPLKHCFFQDSVQDSRQNPCLLIIHVHMVNFQFRCTYTVYLVVILHVSSRHHIKYFYSLKFDVHWSSKKIRGIIFEILAEVANMYLFQRAITLLIFDE